MFKQLLNYLILMALFTHTQAAVLSPQEQQISDWILQQKTNQLSLLERLVNINSGTDNLDGVEKVGDILQHRFEKIGFKTEWFQEPSHLHRAGTLIAKHQGKSGKKILIIGHLDTVFPKTSAFQKFKNLGQHATGPGVIDDKGGDVIILFSLEALHQSGALKDAEITVVLTGDEEDSGKPSTISRLPLFNAAKVSDVALDFENGITPNTATIGRRGISDWTLTIEGKQGHSSQIFKQGGYGTIYESARILQAFMTTFIQEQYLTVNPGVIWGGTTIKLDHFNGMAQGKPNVIASQSIIIGDLRYLSAEKKEKAKRTMEKIVAQSLPHTQSTISFTDGIPAMQPTQNNKRLLQEYSQVSQDLGLGAVKAYEPGLRGAGDISYIANQVPYNLAGLGAIGTEAHSDKETLEIASLTTQTQRAAILLFRLITQNRLSSVKS